MYQLNFYIVFFFEMLGEGFGAIDRAVLATRATERHLQVREVAFDKALYVMVHKGINGIQKCKNLTVFLQKINHRLIQTCEKFVLLILTGIVRSAAVKDIASAITGRVFRQPALKGERVNRY